MADEMKTAEAAPEKIEMPLTAEIVVSMDLRTGQISIKTNCMLVNGLGMLEMAKTLLQDENKRKAAVEAAQRAANSIVPVGADAVKNLEKAGALVRPS